MGQVAFPRSGTAMAPADLQREAQVATLAVIYQMAQMLDALHSLGMRVVNLEMNRLQDFARESQTLITARMTELNELRRREAESSIWSRIQAFFSGIITACAIFLGIMRVSEGDIAGGWTMIGAAITSLMNLIATECNFWGWIAEKISKDNEELQSWLKTLIPGFFMLASLALSITSLCIGNRLPNGGEVLKLLQAASALGEGMTFLAKGVNAFQTSGSRLRLTQTETRLAVIGAHQEAGQNLIRTVMTRVDALFSRGKESLTSFMDMPQRAIIGR